ncbi:hypothetical protein AGLY_012048 [Aphis glycines]|uniref:PWWP domain-containing protein n=1 Tax=Aphis glycines TaxID=307491 RepID=A0A6G0TCJ4_APHGL|nr:hypothetical protein AGLY_012048 [Aphis glycines]
MTDSIVDNTSDCLEKDKLSCSTSSPAPVPDPVPDPDVLADTSNLDDKSKSLSKESPIKEESIEDVKHESPTSENEKKNNFEIGDIVWAKIGKYPFWPSIVCIDPDTNTYLKGSLENKKTFSLHVRFCNDNGRRSWAKVVEMYDGKDKLLEKHPNGLALIKNSLKQMTVWDAAVKEADNWLKVKRNERMVRFSNKNGLSLSEMNGLGASKPKSPHPGSSKTRNRSSKLKTASTQPHDGSYIPTVEEFLASRRAIDLAQAAKCKPSTSGSHVMKSGASSSNSSMPQCYVKLKDIANTKPMAKLLEKPMEKPMELPKKAVKRKYVDPEKKKLREALKKKKAKRALQVKKYGFSYSSSEYESTDDEAPPLVPFNPNRKVLQTLKNAIANLESEGIQRLKEKRILIKAIRLAERTSNFNKKKVEEEESDDEY